MGCIYVSNGNLRYTVITKELLLDCHNLFISLFLLYVLTASLGAIFLEVNARHHAAL